MTQPSDTKHTILILGASYAGLSVTHYLLKHALPSLPNHQIVLVSSSTQVMCRPACPRAMISDDFFDQNKLFADISKQLEQYPKESWSFIHGTATQVDHKNRTATIKSSSNANTQESTIPFHTLVIATGASTPSPLFINNPDLRGAWNSFRTALPSATSIVIAGGGATGVEVAGELGSYLNGQTHSTSKASITLVTSGPRILPDLRPAIAQTAENYLSHAGVTVLKNTKVVGEASGSVTLSTGDTIAADIYIPATGAKPNTSFLAPEILGTDGRVATNPHTLRVDTAGPRIYALGDCSNAFRAAIHQITAAVPVLGANIKRDLCIEAKLPHESEDKVFKEDVRETQLVPIGKAKGVGAAMGWRVPSWFVWLIKGRDYWLWTTGRLWSGKQW
jgi:NADH dehydrogenase FAD-containing subunit